MVMVTEYANECPCVISGVIARCVILRNLCSGAVDGVRFVLQKPPVAAEQLVTVARPHL